MRAVQFFHEKHLGRIAGTPLKSPMSWVPLKWRFERLISPSSIWVSYPWLWECRFCVLATVFTLNGRKPAS